MDERIRLAHGGGGKLTDQLIKKVILPYFDNPILRELDDSAAFTSPKERTAFTTDSYVIKPVFFPGGDIGKLAVCGTVNDLAVKGAVPLYISLALIIEEGFLISDLTKIIRSASEAAKASNVKVVCGDIKVVERGSADGIFINTSGIGKIVADISSKKAKPGDAVILSGPIGDHGISVLLARKEFKFKSDLKSDCAPLNGMTDSMLKASKNIHAMRDLTRGGLGTVLNEIAAASKVGIEIEEEKIPVNEDVRTACEILGLDPLYVANEGKLMAIASQKDAKKIVKAMKSSKFGRKADIIGKVTGTMKAKVVLKTKIGGKRFVDTFSGEQLPRIC
ncbi:hydrogenase expression/formation protein HypE [Candidatus Margulisiibacteriota bacterium]